MKKKKKKKNSWSPPCCFWRDHWQWANHYEGEARLPTDADILALVTHIGQSIFPVGQLPNGSVNRLRVVGFKRKCRVAQMHMDVVRFWPVVHAKDEL